MMPKIEPQSVARLLVQLLEVYTPPGQERRLEHAWQRVCRELGYPKIWRDESSNYFASYGEGEKVIMLASHVDTVPGELPVRIADDRVFGRGAVDAKSSVACMLVGAIAARGQLSDVKVVVAGLADEEGMGRGAKKLVEEGFEADHIIVGEPTGVNGIATSYRGSVTIRVNAKAKGGHSSAPYMAESALDKILDLWRNIQTEFHGRRFEEVTSALTTLHAGDWATRMPDSAEATINIRYPSPHRATTILEKVRQQTEKVGCSITVLDATDPVESSVSAKTARALTRAMLKLGIRPRILKKTGTSDMNTLYAVTDDIVACGPGDSLLAHTSDEQVKVSDMGTAARLYALALFELSRS